MSVYSGGEIDQEQAIPRQIFHLAHIGIVYLQIRSQSQSSTGMSASKSVYYLRRHVFYIHTREQFVLPALTFRLDKVKSHQKKKNLN